MTTILQGDMAQPLQLQEKTSRLIELGNLKAKIATELHGLSHSTINRNLTQIFESKKQQHFDEIGKLREAVDKMNAIDADLFSMFKDGPVFTNEALLEKRLREDQAWLKRWGELKDERLGTELASITAARTAHIIDLEKHYTEEVDIFFGLAGIDPVNVNTGDKPVPVPKRARQNLNKIFKGNDSSKNQVNSLQKVKHKGAKTRRYLEANLLDMRKSMDTQADSFREAQAGYVKDINILNTELACAQEKIRDLEGMLVIEEADGPVNERGEDGKRRAEFHEGEKRRLSNEISDIEEEHTLYKLEMEEILEDAKKEIAMLKEAVKDLMNSRASPSLSPAFYRSSL